MKVSCILLSFICVNVLADVSITEYIHMVELSNMHIKEACDYNDGSIGNGLERVIIYALDTNFCPTKSFHQMFTVPELSRTNYFDYLQASIMTETHSLQRKIFETLGIPMPVIPNESNDILRITTREKERSFLTGKALHNLLKQIFYIPAFDNKYQSISAHDDKFERVYNTSRRAILKLTELGKARRLLTGKAIRNVLTQKLGEYKSGLISYDKMYSVHRNCTLIAMWFTLKTASLTADSVRHVQDIDICIVYDKDWNAVKYRPFKSIYWQVNVNKMDTKIEELNVQLLDDSSIPKFEKQATCITF
ncbi:uncharacterized protein LOC126839804 [Adelges cooleyi]|uniref:uncharacterized protein LOC126839804 n=1 Tax=Adelges cooleyi TaxID=133065 RepID=UPI0021807A13|nr:uncharacterized protein LOC126839804 [Adelges cooleyi]